MADLEGSTRKALLTQLMERLLANGSWCGETHVQKCVYFLQDLHQVPVGYDFVLYKHGPYSFDLHDELIEMKAYGLLVTEPRSPYGPTLKPGERANALLERRQRLGSLYPEQVEEVAKRFGNATATDLEHLATALFITKRQRSASRDRATTLNRLKPHISIRDAQSAVAAVDQLLATGAGQPAG